MILLCYDDYSLLLEVEDKFSTKEADAEVAVLAEADTSQLSEAVCVVQDVTLDEALPGSGEVEVSTGYNNQDTLPALEGDTETLPDAGLSRLNSKKIVFAIYYIDFVGVYLQLTSNQMVLLLQ